MNRKMLLPTELLLFLLLLVFSVPALAYYDPGVQRWINRDPVEEAGGLNLFRFVLNNPVTQIDIFGTSTLDDLSDENSKNSNDYRQKDECGPPTREECNKQWAEAFADCRKHFKESPIPPWVPRGRTPGKNWSLADCAAGFVTEECGGNPVEHPKKKKRKKYYW